MALLSEHERLVEKVIQEEYYTNILRHLKQPTSDGEIINFWHNFWDYLPDSPSIQREPFWEICDMAEKIFDDEYFE